VRYATGGAYPSKAQESQGSDVLDSLAKLVTAGELLIGLGLLLGAFTGFAALAGLLMNFNFVYAGSTSVNPTLIILEALVLYSWKIAGWYGLDRFLLPVIGTPWAPGAQSRSSVT
jgi:thiosulfate dehydrogenase (quinone) large subunit